MYTLQYTILVRPIINQDPVIKLKNDNIYNIIGPNAYAL